MSDAPKVIAFYLPQFQPVPENDAWWGSGFTEWTNVVRARPLIEGQHQPQLPTHTGFYDLRVPETRQRQAHVAREHGIDGFLYYHYWFGGQRVLDRTFDEVLNSGRPDFPFALCWANENWTRAWDAGENEVLLEQRYGAEERAQHIDWLLAAFEDPRYIRVDGHPLFTIYRVQALPDADGFFDELRAVARSRGVPEPHVVAFETHGRSDVDPAEVGCDAVAQFLPHGVGDRVPARSVASEGDRPHQVYEYDEVASIMTDVPPPSDWARYECVFPGWDNTARRQQQGATIVANNTPARYEEWLRVVHQRAPERGGIVFINAWNEWAEGAHLEPDDRWDDAFLAATARAVGAVPHPDSDDGRSGGYEPVVIGPTFAELYLDVYERYVLAQRKLTSIDATIRREVARRTEDVERELVEERARSGELARQLESAGTTERVARASTDTVES